MADSNSDIGLLHGLRVCFVAGTLGQGGAERQLFYIASALKAAGAQVLVLSLTSGEVWESRLQDLGIPVQFVGASASRLKRLITIIEAVGAFRPEIVQSQHFHANAYSAIAARLYGARAVGAARGNGFSDLNSCGRVLGRLCLNLPHRLAVNSRAAMRNLASLGCRDEKLHYLPNVLDLAQFPAADSNHDDPATILGIGRFTAEKRFDRFLRILGLLRHSCNVPIKAVLAGDGPLRPELERLTQDSNLGPGTVEFCGNVAEVQPLYQRSHILLLTSDREGTPNVVMEAMASGLPVVATNVGGAKELIEDGVTGFLFEPADEQGAVARLEQLIRNRELCIRAGQQARQFIQRHRSPESLPQFLAGLYDKATRTN